MLDLLGLDRIIGRLHSESDTNSRRLIIYKKRKVEIWNHLRGFEVLAEWSVLGQANRCRSGRGLGRKGGGKGDCSKYCCFCCWLNHLTTLHFLLFSQHTDSFPEKEAACARLNMWLQIVCVIESIIFVEHFFEPISPYKDPSVT